MEETVHSCIPCQASNPKHTHHEPIRTTPLPAAPWSEISVDFAGPFPSGECLPVVIDDYSRFPEVEILPSLSANVVIPRLNMIFARQGYPTIVKTDTGPPFQGQDFKDFATQSGFRHRRITPLWPVANGEVERFVHTLKRYILAITVEGFNWKTQLPHFLRQYRATPHSTIKIYLLKPAPAEKWTLAHLTLLRTQHQDGYMIVKLGNSKGKEIMKWYADGNKKSKPSSLCQGDQILIKQKR